MSFFASLSPSTKGVIALTVLTAVLTGGMSFWAWYVESMQPGVRSPDEAPTSLQPPNEQDPLSALLDHPRSAAPQANDARPISDPPAGLPVYTGARRMDAHEQRDGAWIQQWGVWSIAQGNAQEVLSFYRDAAQQKGFSTVKDWNENGDASSHMVMRRSGQLLKIRVAKRGSRLLLTLIFRYTVS